MRRGLRIESFEWACVKVGQEVILGTFMFMGQLFFLEIVLECTWLAQLRGFIPGIVLNGSTQLGHEFEYGMHEIG